jgi:hypothetical protein
MVRYKGIETPHVGYNDWTPTAHGFEHRQGYNLE